jgi:hypothetical protein
VLAAVDPRDEDGSAVLDVEVAFVLACHGSSLPLGLGRMWWTIITKLSS